MIYKNFKEWANGQWLEDGEPRKQAYTRDELLLIEMGWNYGVDAARLAQPEPEPVMLMDAPLLLNGQPLYTAPPQRVYCSCGDGIVANDGALCGICVSLKKMREWQGLTDEEANELCFASVEEIEAKLREKNI